MIKTIVYHTLQLYVQDFAGAPTIESLQFTTDDGNVHPGPNQFYGQTGGQKYTIDMSSNNCYLHYFSGNVGFFVNQLSFSWCCES